MTAFDEVEQEQARSASGPPVAEFDDTVQVERQVGPALGREVPDGGSLLAVAFVHHHQSLVARDRRPADGVQGHARVDALRDRSAPVRGSTTRSAGWSRSPCSACSRHSRDPSGREPAAVEPAALVTGDADPPRCCGRAPSQVLRRPTTYTANPSRSLTAAATTSPACATPLVPALRDAVQEAAGPRRPRTAATYHRPASLPVSSCQNTTPGTVERRACR